MALYGVQQRTKPMIRTPVTWNKRNSSPSKVHLIISQVKGIKKKINKSYWYQWVNVVKTLRQVCTESISQFTLLLFIQYVWKSSHTLKCAYSYIFIRGFWPDPWSAYTRESSLGYPRILPLDHRRRKENVLRTVQYLAGNSGLGKNPRNQ
jgi:hypothetical protein